ncbi:hypothetical protein ACS0TY_019246 [Phlomoides rotata]
MNLLLVIFGVIFFMTIVAGECEFKAVFNFGDSNSDTGGYYAAFPALHPPYGITYFKQPAGRASDGRLIIDFLAQSMGIPFLSHYLRSIGSDFRYGVNFATVSSTVVKQNDTTISPFSLDVQLNQLKQFKQIVDDHYSSDLHMPQPEVFKKSIYTIYIGQNDFTKMLQSCSVNNMSALRDVVSGISSTIKEIYGLGGRTFLVFNLAPMGCYPELLVESRNASDIDTFGCLISCNNVVDAYNSMLRAGLDQARHELPEGDLIHVDTHTILRGIFDNPTSYGIEFATRACCGYGDGPYNYKPDVVFCGSSKVIAGKNVTASVCNDPDKYVHWDGIHLTEATNRIVAAAILGGSYFDPPFPMSDFCAIQPVG